MRTLVPILGLLITACAPVADPLGTSTPSIEPDEPVVQPGEVEPGEVEPATPVGSTWEPGAARSISGMTVIIDDNRFLMAAPDERGVWLVDSNGGSSFVGLDGEITRLVRVGDDVLATSRDTGELLRLTYEDGNIVVADRIPVGTEPYDVVVSRESDTAWVSLSVEGVVVELDLPSFTETRRWEVTGEPHSMAVVQHDGIEHVAVASAYAPRITYISVADGETFVRRLPDLHTDEGEPMSARITGDIALEATTGSMLVPAVYADTSVPGTPGESEGTDGGIMGTGQGAGPNGPGQHEGEFLYGSSPEAEKGMFNPTVVKMAPSGDHEILSVATSQFNMDFDMEFARGVPTEVVVLPSYASSPSGSPLLMVTSSSGHVVMLDQSEDMMLFPPAEGFAPVSKAAFYVGPGARGAVVLPGDPHNLWSVAAHGSTVVSVDVEEAWHVILESAFLFEMPGMMMEGVVEHRGSLPASPLPPAVFNGRALFHSANDARVAMPGSGASCAGCHLEGRTDGRTWRFEDFPRQTPSLAGHISSTLPLTWTGEVASVLDEVHTTSSTRMGGAGLSHGDASDIAAYVDWTREVMPVLPTNSAEEALVAQGEALFHDPAVACATCHSGAEQTNGQQYPIYGLDSIDTPSLTGIAGSAPYLHDGSARTLREVVEMSQDGSMGYTGGLSSEQMDALVAYLRTL